MTSRAWATLAVVVLLAGCSAGADRDAAGGADPLAAGCDLVEEHVDRDVARDDVAAMRTFADALTAEADTLSTSDAAELRPLARAAAAVATTPTGTEAADVHADYLRTLAATADVCEAAGSPAT
ncbi:MULTISPECIES: hypothetical protein [unclassified Aeromicrobium]|uniref:hypothetical protein n=1 Tax=unclassified Aeromicrobium TaxID=2633570 RepID=UPI0006F9474E|nr:MULTISPECIES: hypothetical protein [unclassified Aeromicrobium]KQO37272.1 hypothetical protein ASF05_05520 [Aeromicrobium sp. Leaf245]KQP75289.1 hypothetical protein ASF37_15660 [Aeromicrobium sp. Leaf289]